MRAIQTGLAKRLFEGHGSQVAISSTGLVCANTPSVAPDVPIYDIEGSGTVKTLSASNTSTAPDIETRTAFAWSPAARYIVAASTDWQAQLHVFDCHERTIVGTFGQFSALPRRLAWSNAERYLAVATHDPKSASLQLWQKTENGVPFGGKPVSTLAASDSMERQTYEAEFGDEGAFSGYGQTLFSPDEKSLASVIEINGDWADDSILLTDAPSLRKRAIYPARGHVTDFTWTPDSRQIIYCAAGQAYRLTTSTNEEEELPFGAEMCAYHPQLPVCLCFSSWVKDSSRGRLFLADMNRLTVYDEHEAEDIGGLRWNLDGTKAFAVTRSGLAYVYEPSFL